LRAVLADQLGTDPDPRTTALHTSILREEPLAEAEMGLPLAPALDVAVDSSDPSFVGRDQEFAQLSIRWSEAVAGKPSLVVIAGEAGIGKTTLAGEIVRLAERTGGSVAHARCYQAEHSLFLQPFVDAVRSIVVTTPPEVVCSLAGEWDAMLAELVPEGGRVFTP